MKKHIQQHYIHGIRALLLGVLLLSVITVRFDLSSPTLVHNARPKVLAYATSMNAADLLSAANASRSANGLAPFRLDPQLNASAQAKAEDMVNKNYWSHTAPDGTQPWYFFKIAGYNYSAAGENLAYGFNTSTATNAGWMASDGHRANILGAYNDVGFGIVNGASYQGGQYTIVVAHYGTRMGASPTPAPAPTPTPAPAPTPPAPVPAPLPTTPAPAPAPSATNPVPSPAETPSDSSPSSPVNNLPESPIDNNKNTENTPSADTQTSPSSPVRTSDNRREVSVIESLSTGSTPTVAFLGLGTVLTTTLGFAAAHRSLMNRALSAGSRYLVSHPIVDILAIATSVALILTATVGHLR